MEHQDIRLWAERVRQLMTLAQGGSVAELDAAYTEYLKALGNEHTIVEAILDTCDAEKQNGIHVAAQAGNVDAMEWFATQIDRDILVNVKSKNGTTPLMFAVKGNQPEMVKLLLSWGADVYHADHAKLTSIHLALTIPEDTRVLNLLTANLQPHDSLYNPATVTGSLLTWCVLTNNISLFKKIVDISEPQRLADDCLHSTLPCAVVAAAHAETAGVVLHYLLAKGVAPNAIAGAQDQQGSTVLANLAQLEDPTILQRLLEGCTPDCVRELCQRPGEYGKTPYQLAASQGARDILAQYVDDSTASTQPQTEPQQLTPVDSDAPVLNLPAYDADLISRAEQLKQQANSLFSEKSYVDAEANFEEACKILKVEDLAAMHDNLPVNEEVRGLISTLAANLSVTCLRLHALEKAELNARRAIQFAPDWYKGYYRLGMVMKARSDYAEAAQQLYECCLRNTTDESLL